jgi:hypothetical protein
LIDAATVPVLYNFSGFLSTLISSLNAGTTGQQSEGKTEGGLPGDSVPGQLKGGNKQHTPARPGK